MQKLITFIVALAATISLWAGNVITYTADEKLPEVTEEWDEGLQVNAFNAAIVSHTFADGTGTITFSGDVTTVGEDAFSYCFGLISVTLPASVTTIGAHAFEGCSQLRDITIPDSVTLIGAMAFGECKSLLSVAIPEGVTTISDYTFYLCSSLTRLTIPESVTSIGIRAFEDCYGLVSLIVPASVTSIGVSAFSGVKNLIYTGSLSSTLWGALYQNGYEEELLVYTDNTKTQLVGCSAAAQGDIFLPATITSIGNGAFIWCDNITSVTIPESVTSIGDGVFYFCENLASITIPNSVTSIGDYAFRDCRNMSTIRFLGDVPPTVGESTFNMVPSDANVYVPCGTSAAYAAVFTGFSNFIEVGCNPTSHEDLCVDGTAEVLSSAGRTECSYVQLWEDGPKWATFNVGATISRYDSLVVGADSVLFYDHSEQAPYYNTANVGGLYAWNNPYHNGRMTYWGDDTATGIADVATTLWGELWQTPTSSQQTLLTDTSLTRWTWCDGTITQYVLGCNLAGYKVSGRGDFANKSIFLPTSGWLYGYGPDSTIVYTTEVGVYWSSTAYNDTAAYDLGIFEDGTVSIDYDDAFLGLSVRAVLVESTTPTALGNKAAESKAKKIIENGQLIIILDDKRYTITGAQL